MKEGGNLVAPAIKPALSNTQAVSLTFNADPVDYSEPSELARRCFRNGKATLPGLVGGCKKRKLSNTDAGRYTFRAFSEGKGEIGRARMTAS